MNSWRSLLNLVTTNTVEELKSMMRIIFAPDPERFKDFGETDLCYEEVQQYLDVHDSDLAPGLDIYSDEWYDVVDNLTVDDVVKWAIDDGNHPAIKNFEPCCVVWRFESSFDRMGDVNIRVFKIVPVTEMTPQYWIEQYDAYQKERAEEYERYKRLVEKMDF